MTQRPPETAEEREHLAWLQWTADISNALDRITPSPLSHYGCSECSWRGWIESEYGEYDKPYFCLPVQACGECATEDFDDVNAAELAAEMLPGEWFIGWHGTGALDGNGYTVAVGGDVWITRNPAAAGADGVDES